MSTIIQAAVEDWGHCEGKQQALHVRHSHEELTAARAERKTGSRASRRTSLDGIYRYVCFRLGIGSSARDSMLAAMLAEALPRSELTELRAASVQAALVPAVASVASMLLRSSNCLRARQFEGKGDE